MTDTTFFPTDEVKSRLMTMTQGGQNGKIECCPDNYESHDTPRTGDTDKVGPLLAGGPGLFETAKDFLALLKTTLASGLEGENRPRWTILSKGSHDEMFKDVCASFQEPDEPHSGKQSLLKIMEMTGSHEPTLLEDQSGSRVGHAVRINLNLIDSQNGREADSGCWDGEEDYRKNEAERMMT